MKEHTKELVLAAVVYTGFFSVIIAAIVLTGSAYCLWGLLLMPSMKMKKGNDKDA